MKVNFNLVWLNSQQTGTNNMNFKIIVIAIVLPLVMVTGWVKNLVSLTECDFMPPYKAEVIRTVGLIPPIGAIVGYLSIEDK